MDIKVILNQHKLRIVLAIVVISAEALLTVSFPFFIGKAIDGSINNSIAELWQLAALVLLLIALGSLRRLFDSRFYAKLYIKISALVVRTTPTEENSTKVAHVNMLSEMVNFAENELPEIIQHSIGLLGVVSIIAYLNWYIFLGAIFAGVLVICVYSFSTNKTITHNRNLNNEFENQANVIYSNRQSAIRFHFMQLMRSKIKLSDIETINFSISWGIMMLLLLTTIHLSASQGVQYGALFALIMYVYQYIESVVSLPLYYQQWLRLSEITHRLQNINSINSTLG